MTKRVSGGKPFKGAAGARSKAMSLGPIPNERVTKRKTPRTRFKTTIVGSRESYSDDLTTALTKATGSGLAGPIELIKVRTEGAAGSTGAAPLFRRQFVFEGGK